MNLETYDDVCSNLTRNVINTLEQVYKHYNSIESLQNWHRATYFTSKWYTSYKNEKTSIWTSLELPMENKWFIISKNIEISLKEYNNVMIGNYEEFFNEHRIETRKIDNNDDLKRFIKTFCIVSPYYRIHQTIKDEL